MSPAMPHPFDLPSDWRQRGLPYGAPRRRRRAIKSSPDPTAMSTVAAIKSVITLPPVRGKGPDVGGGADVGGGPDVGGGGWGAGEGPAVVGEADGEGDGLGVTDGEGDGLGVTDGEGDGLGVWFAVTVAVSSSVTGAPDGVVPVTVPVFTMLPRFTSAWVVVYVASQVIDAAGSRLEPCTGSHT